VNHQSQFPAVTLTFNLAPGVALGDAVSAIEAAVRPLGSPPCIQGASRAPRRSSRPRWPAALADRGRAPRGVRRPRRAVRELHHPLTILSTLPWPGWARMLALLAFRTDLT